MKFFSKILIISSLIASSLSFAQNSGETFFSTAPDYDSASRLGIDRNKVSLDKKYSFENCDLFLGTAFAAEEYIFLALDQTPGKKAFFENVKLFPYIWPMRSTATCESPFVISGLETKWSIDADVLFADTSYDEMRVFYLKDSLLVLAIDNDGLVQNAVRIDLKKLATTQDLANSLSYYPPTLFENAFMYMAFLHEDSLYFQSVTTNLNQTQYDVSLNRVNLFTFKKDSLNLGKSKSMQMYPFEVNKDGSYMISAFPRLDEGGGFTVNDEPKIIDLKTFTLVKVQNTQSPAGYKKMLSSHFINPLRPYLNQFVNIYETAWSQTTSSADYKIVVTQFDAFSGQQKILFEKELKGMRFTNMLFTKEDPKARKVSMYFLSDWANEDYNTWWQYRYRGPNLNPHASLIINYDMVTGVVQLAP